MIRKHKKYSKPRRKFDLERVKEENEIIKKYGLKNKREIWKIDAEVGRIRKRAKSLITKNKEEQDKFINKLKKKGFKISNLADILALNKEDLLKRRLQSIVNKKKNTPIKAARQLIVHKHIFVDNKIINVPSYMVSVDEEEKIEIKARKIKNKTKQKGEENA